MKPLRLRIRDAAKQQGIPQEVIEKVKSAHRGVSFHWVDDFFTNELISETIRH
jgi:hypothetical protein